MTYIRMRAKILWKIYVIWFFRRIVPLMALQVFVFGLAFKLFANKVFVGDVLDNAGIAASSNYVEFFKYLIEAFFKAQPLTQAVTLIIWGVSSLILRDIARAVAAYIKTHLKK